MARLLSLRSLMILIAAVALSMAAYEFVIGRVVRKEAAQLARSFQHTTKYNQLQGYHEAELAAWERRIGDRERVIARIHGEIWRWRDLDKVRDSAELERRPLAEVTHWVHPDPDDFFPILQGPSADWGRRLDAYRSLVGQCRERAMYHRVRVGMSWNAMAFGPDDPVFAKELAEPPPAVDPYPPAYRAEYDAIPLPRRPAVELVTTNPDGITRQP